MTEFKSRFLGHEIEWKNDGWIYSDTGENCKLSPQRKCTKCNKYPTKEGHDPCIENLENVKFACCGHGYSEQAYVYFTDEKIIRDTKAIAYFTQIGKGPVNVNDKHIFKLQYGSDNYWYLTVNTKSNKCSLGDRFVGTIFTKKPNKNTLRKAKRNLMRYIKRDLII